MIRPRISFPFLAVLMVACNDATPVADSTDLRVERDQARGFELIRNSGEPPGWTLDTLVAVGSIGGMGEPSPDEFGHLTSVVPDPDHNLWVADAQHSEVRVFDGSGALVRQFGREGQGPGEFLSIYSLGWVGDRLLVLDLGNGRVGVLDQEGKWLETRPAPGRVTGSPALLRFYPTTDTSATQWSLVASDAGTARVWIEHGPDSVLNEWTQLPVEAPAPTGVRCDRPDGGISFFEIPFGGQVFQLPARDKTAFIGWSRDYRIARVDSSGDTLRLIERLRPDEPITDDEWLAGSAEFRDFRDEWPGAQCSPSDLQRPPFKAAFHNMLIAPDGALWVEVHSGGGTEWEIFGPDGALVATLPGFEYDPRVAPHIQFGALAWVTRDSLGVQRAFLARIEKGGRGGS